MKHTLYLFQISLIALLFLGFASCGSNNKEDNAEGTSDTTAVVKTDSANPTRDFFYSLPSPLLMAKIFKV